MSHRVSIDGHAIDLLTPGSHALLTSLANDYPETDKAASLALAARDDGLHLMWANPVEQTIKSNTPLDLHIDFKLLLSLRSFPAAKQGAFNQALGKKTKTVIDATGGWGADALLMCSQGYQVHIIERNPVMAALLQDAMGRLADSDWVRNELLITPTVTLGQASKLLKLGSSGLSADCVYLDPMFPAKRKKTAAVNKKMALLQYLVGEDLDASEMLEAAYAGGYSRVAVKRPNYASALKILPNTYRQPIQFSSKLVHYDVYFA